MYVCVTTIQVKCSTTSDWGPQCYLCIVVDAGPDSSVPTQNSASETRVSHVTVSEPPPLPLAAAATAPPLATQ